jgi:hypothetical protein
MSSVVISGNTSGTITLDAPAVAGTTTLTLPATSGTVVTKDTNGIASVNGVQFPATQSASADANTLDDYEEGTWTPNLVAASGSITAQTTTGSYAKVGKLVIVRLNITSITVGASTTLNINNLPFTVSATGGGSASGQGIAREDKATGLTWLLGALPNSTTANLLRYDNSSTATSSLGWNGTLSYISA